VQQAKASAGHSSKATASCMGRLRLGLQATQGRLERNTTWTTFVSDGGFSTVTGAIRLRPRAPVVPALSCWTVPSPTRLTVSSPSTSCSTLTSCSLTTTTACAPAAPQLASVPQGDRHAEDPLREDQGCPRRQPKQPESLRLWRSDRMWTPSIITTTISTTMNTGKGDDLTSGRQTRRSTWNETDACIAKSFCSNT
jgi:hypothetical protein